jgi:hypothetical protein
MMKKLHHSSFWRGRSFAKSCAQHLLDVRNYTVKLQKNLAGNRFKSLSRERHMGTGTSAERLNGPRAHASGRVVQYYGFYGSTILYL